MRGRARLPYCVFHNDVLLGGKPHFLRNMLGYWSAKKGRGAISCCQVFPLTQRFIVKSQISLGFKERLAYCPTCPRWSNICDILTKVAQVLKTEVITGSYMPLPGQEKIDLGVLGPVRDRPVNYSGHPCLYYFGFMFRRSRLVQFILF